MFSTSSPWGKVMILIVVIVLLIGGIIQTERKYDMQRCKHIQVKIIPIIEQNFIDEHNIFSYLASRFQKLDSTTPLHSIPTKELENILKSHNFVQHCSVHKSWQGNLAITILPRKILARIINTACEDAYIDNEGTILPLSSTYTPRVVLVESEKKYKVSNHIDAYPEGQGLLNMLQIIAEDIFWQTQITHIYINDKEEVILATKFGRHKVHFGKFEQLEDKFKRLKLFYEVILPQKGWDVYKQINLKFDTQIICE